jgi:hypothetical protein
VRRYACRGIAFAILLFATGYGDRPKTAGRIDVAWHCRTPCDAAPISAGRWNNCGAT